MAENEPNSGLGPEGREEGLTPWEQHAAVINIPRFDYNAPSSLLEYSHSGFLITCPIKREKSATKEAISILEKFIVSQSCGSSSECLEVLDANVAAKRRKVCIEERNGKGGNNLESTKDGDTIRDSDGISKETSSFSAKIGVEFSQVLSLVKLTRSGLLLLTIPRNSSYNTVDILSNIFCSLDSRSLKAPLWIHRILPIQATCSLNEMDLRRVVSKLVQQFLDDKQNNVERPVKFAVGYNRRGIEETEMKTQRNTSKDSSSFNLLDREKCFSVVAGAVKDVLPDSVVDLKAPQLAILVELLPLSGVPNGSLVVAVSVLPSNLVSTKPRLCVKALISDIKTLN